MADTATQPYISPYTQKDGVQSGATVNLLPDWYTQYGKNLTGAGLNLMGNNVTNYTGFDGQRVAGLDTQQQQAALGAGAMQGSWQPNMTTANTQVNNQVGALQQAGSYLDPARINAGAGGTTLAGNTQNQAQLDAYMDPYRTNVVNEIQRLGNQNLNENVLPGVNSTFTGAGQFGSTRNAEFENRAIRDNQQLITGAQGQFLSQATQNAQNQYAAEQNRLLQSGATLGGLSAVGAGVAAGYGNAANTAAGIGQMGQNLQMNDINSLLTTGGLAQGVQQKSLDAQYQDFLDQRDHPIQTLGALSQVLPNVSGRIAPDTRSSVVNQPLSPDPYYYLRDINNTIGQISGS